MTLFIIYGKTEDMKLFRPIDLKENTFVRKLFYASMLNNEEAHIVLEDLTKHNPNMKFKLKEVK